jgi:hypothetical protein
MMKEQEYITQLIRRVEWVEEDLPTSAGMAAAAILTAVPVIRDVFPNEAIKLLESFSSHFYDGMDEIILINDLEALDM